MEIRFTRLRERCDVMANRSDREQGQPTECRRSHSLISRMGPCSRNPSRPQVSTACINRPDRRLHSTNATTSNYLLQCGSHPQKTFVIMIGLSALRQKQKLRRSEAARAFAETAIRSVELRIQPGAKDAIGEMGVGGD